MTKRCICILPSLLVAGLAVAQQSPSYKLEESVFNSGGDPNGGAYATSSSYRITLDAIGEGVIGTGLASGSFRMDGGFAGAHPPPGEILGVRFDTKTMMSWNPERSVGTYNVYRGLLSTIPGSYGACLQNALGSPSTTDPANPSAGSPVFYLATAKSRLNEEGTLGARGSHGSPGPERPNLTPCP